MKNTKNDLLKYLRWLFSIKPLKVIHGPKTRYGLVLLACVVISGDVLCGDIEPEFFHFDCKRVDTRFDQLLEVDGGYAVIDTDRGKMWCKDSAEIVRGFFALRESGEANRVLKIGMGDMKCEPVRSKASEQRTDDTETTRYQSNFVGSKLHDVLVILAGGFGGIAIGLFIVWLAFYCMTPNAQVHPRP